MTAYPCRIFIEFQALAPSTTIQNHIHSVFGNSVNMLIISLIILSFLPTIFAAPVSVGFHMRSTLKVVLIERSQIRSLETSLLRRSGRNTNQTSNMLSPSCKFPSQLSFHSSQLATHPRPLSGHPSTNETNVQRWTVQNTRRSWIVF